MTTRARPSHQSAARMLWRAVGRRCPNCGARGLFRAWVHMLPRCPSCGLALERKEEGYAVGAYMFNIIAAELVFAGIFVLTLVALWPDPPWALLTWVGAVLMVLMPAAFYPVSKTLFLAFDLIVRPAGYDPAELSSGTPGSGETS